MSVCSLKLKLCLFCIMHDVQPLTDVGERIKHIETLDLDPIKIKLLLSDDGPKWDRAKIELVEKQYRRFLILNLKNNGRKIVPNKEIDAFWHRHILDTMKYAEDCQKIFGYFLHHFPYFGMRGEEDAKNLQQAFQETRMLFEGEFGEKLVGSNGDCDAEGCDAEQCGPAECHNRGVDQTRPTFAQLVTA